MCFLGVVVVVMEVAAAILISAVVQCTYSLAVVYVVSAVVAVDVAVEECTIDLGSWPCLRA